MAAEVSAKLHRVRSLMTVADKDDHRPSNCPCWHGLGRPLRVARGAADVTITYFCPACGYRWDVWYPDE
jgi:hypothetical protein